MTKAFADSVIVLGDLTTTGVLDVSSAATIGGALDVGGSITGALSLDVAGEVEGGSLDIVDLMTVSSGATNEVALLQQQSATGAKSTLRLIQADLSEEFIEFTGNVSAGNPIQTGAIGTYYGKVRVSVNGTFKYIALYNS